MRRTSVISEALNRLNNINENPYQKYLDEDLKGYFKNQYLKKFIERNRDYLRGPEKDVNERAMEMALDVAKIDPTFKGREIENKEEALNKNQGSYFDWLIRLINKGTVTYTQLIQDAHEYTDQLKAFDDQKKRNRLPSDKKDIMQFKSLHDLMDMLMELGAAADENTTHSDFKQDIKDIRQGIANICRYENVNNIPQDIQSVDDVLELVGENDEWEVWAAKNKYGTMLFDSWGKGAGWCVGGMLGAPRNGEQQADSASSYFDSYARNGGTYVCFQRKDKNASRPTNKYLITLGPNGSRPNNGYSGYQFNDSNNRTVGGDSSDEGAMDALANFLKENGLVDVMKNSRFKELEALNVVDNLERLANGEPFIYNGGKIRKGWRNNIKKIVFKYNGETYTVDAENNPEFLNAESINEMFNIKELSEGKPYVYDGNKISENIKPAIKEIVFSDQYSLTPEEARVRFPNVPEDGGGFFAIPTGAFRNLPDVHLIHLPANVTIFGYRCFDGLPEDCVILTPRFPNRRLSIFPQDVPTIKRLIKYADEDVKAFNDEEE